MDAITLLISKAHAEFRRLRSGELGDNLRAQGIEYKIIWGLESYRLKEIAAKLMESIQQQAGNDPDEVNRCQTATAQALWAEDVRESRMLAPRLYPADQMTPEEAEVWAKSVRYTELADQLCMHLLSRTPFAESLVRQWITASPMMQYMALQIALRLDLDVPEAEDIAADTALPMYVRIVANKAIKA